MCYRGNQRKVIRSIFRLKSFVSLATTSISVARESSPLSFSLLLRTDSNLLTSLYSDCGGGGGVRLGTGKWRSKELFKDGKKTCSLRHQRLGAFPEMEYQVWKNMDIPRDELEEVSEKCGEMFTNQMLGGKLALSTPCQLPTTD